MKFFGLGTDHIMDRLINSEGLILGKAGEYAEDKSLSAIMIHVWEDYLEFGKEMLKQKDMTYIFINTQNSRILAKKLSTMVLLIRANKDSEIGMLKIKADILTKMLEEELKELEACCKKEEIII